MVGIFKSRFLKRLESSIDAFRISIRRALEFVKTFAEYVQDGIVLDAASFQVAMRLLENDDEDVEDVSPHSRATEMDESDAARHIIEALPRLDANKYDRRRIHRALQEDIDALTEIWHDIRGIHPTTSFNSFFFSLVLGVVVPALSWLTAEALQAL